MCRSEKESDGKREHDEMKRVVVRDFLSSLLTSSCVCCCGGNLEEILYRTGRFNICNGPLCGNHGNWLEILLRKQLIILQRNCEVVELFSGPAPSIEDMCDVRLLAQLYCLEELKSLLQAASSDKAEQHQSLYTIVCKRYEELCE